MNLLHFAPSSNPSLQRSLTALSHPLTWLALAVLLINDHLLRVVWPSWWTGKLGDFAWLFFAPLVMAALFSIVIPAHWVAQSKIVACLSFLGTALIFSLAKTLPVFHSLTVQLATILFQSPVSLLRDPSDLVALGMMPLGWWLWHSQPVTQPIRSARGWIAIPLAALLTIANSLPPSYGMICLTSYQQQTIALGGYSGGFITSDGGLSWQPVPWEKLDIYPYCMSSSNTLTCALAKGQPGSCSLDWAPGQYGFMPYSNPNNPNACTLALPDAQGICSFPPTQSLQTLRSLNDPDVLFKFQAGESIQISTDGGQTWSQAFRLANNEAQSDYLASSFKGLSARVPLDGIVDLQTNNAIFAMGFEGLLVYRMDSKDWQWISLAGFAHKEIALPDLVMSLITDEFLLGLVFGILALVTLSLPYNKSFIRIFFTLVAWITWGIPVLFLRYPHGYDPYGLTTAVPVFACIGISALIGLMLLVSRANRFELFDLKVFIANGLLFIIPYFLWTLGSLPHYETARLFAILLAGICLIVEIVWVRSQFNK